MARPATGKKVLAKVIKSLATARTIHELRQAQVLIMTLEQRVSMEQAAAAGRLGKGLAGQPVPVMILARLAVDRRFQGVGRALLKDALLRTAQAAEIAGIRAILVHAKDDAARNRYLQWGFEPSPTDPYHLFLLIKDLHALLK